VQAEARAFLQAFLKPGGLVYICYNALPGWSSFLPIREVMRTFTEDLDLPPVERADEAIRILKMLRDDKIPFISSSSNVRRELRRISGQSRRYLAHEFLNVHWMPRFFSEVCAEMDSIGLSFSCTARLTGSASRKKLLARFADFIDSQKSPEKREAAISMVVNDRLRRDIYVGAKAARVPDPTAVRDSLLVGNARTRRLKKEPNIEKAFDGAAPSLDDVTGGRLSIGEIRSLPALGSLSEDQALAGLQHLLEKGWVRPLSKPARKWDATTPPEKIRLPSLFNQVVLRDDIYTKRAYWLASPVTGDGVSIDQISRLLLLGALEGGVANAADEAFKILDETKETLRVDDKRVRDPKDQRAAFQDHADEFRKRQVPVLIRLGILEEST
jgi:hypothetical protein